MFKEAFSSASRAELMDTVQALLSATREFRNAIACELSSIPVHPYDRYRAEYLGVSSEPLTLRDIPEPQTFCPYTCTQEISAISEKMNESFYTQISYLTSQPLTSFEMEAANYTAFSNLSVNEETDEQTLVVDKERAGNYLKFIDLVKTLPLAAIEYDAEGTARKLITQYIKLLK